jgi:pyridoxine 4-dehydrogenase
MGFEGGGEGFWRYSGEGYAKVSSAVLAGVLGENLRLVDEIRRIAETKECTVSQVAIGWVCALSGKSGRLVVILLPGATSERRVGENMVGGELSKDEMKLIEGVLERIPVQGGRWRAALQQISDL